MSLTISGRLESTRADHPSLANCRVEVFFDLKAPEPQVPILPERDRGAVAARGRRAIVGTDEPGAVVPVAGPMVIRNRVSARSDRLGKFEVSLPDGEELASKKLRFVVSAPSGETIGDSVQNSDRIKDGVTIPVSAQYLEPIPLKPLAEPPQPETRRINGRVIDRQAKPLPASIQVLLFARKEGEKRPKTAGEEDAVLAVRADSSGYFFGEVPNEEYASAAALVSGVDEEIPIRLEKGFIPARIMLVIDFPEAIVPAAKPDCECEIVKAPPRNPTQVDIANAPDTYSDDLGTGQCVRFNTPNRAIEEFDFYTVVRNTEPDIAGFTLGEGWVSTNTPSSAVEDARDTARKAAEEAAAAATAENAAAAANGVATAMWLAAQAAEAAIGFSFFGTPANRAEAAASVQAAKQRVDETKAALDIASQARKEADDKAARAAAYAKALADADAARAAAGRQPGRAELDATNPIDWDNTPTFYEAATVAHGHLLHFKQVWYADGYSLGDLLYSLPLAPGQKKLISVVDWERRERAERTETTSGAEGLSAALSRDRDLGEVVTGTLTESARGGSKNTTEGIGFGTGAAGNGSYEGFNFGALLGISGGVGASESSAWQDASKNVAANSLQTLRDRTLQSASAVRSIRSSVIHTVTQGEAVQATTEVVANHNHCHALTIQYFEVLRHLKVTHELTDVQECLFVPLPITQFDRAKLLRWRQTLQTYLQRPELMGGFDASRRVETSWTEVDYPLQRYADETVMSLNGEFQITIIIPLPPMPERPKPRPEDSLADTATAIAEATNPTTGFLGILGAIFTGGASLLAGVATGAAVNATKATIQGARALADDLYAQPTPQEAYDKFQREVMPGVAAGFVDQLELWVRVNGVPIQINDADFTLVSDYQPGVPLLASVRATLAGQFRRGDVTELIIKSENGLPNGCRVIVNRASVRYRTSTFEHNFVDDQRVNDDIDLPKMEVAFGALFDMTITKVRDGAGATIYTPIDAWEQRNPRTEDRRLSAELVDHLNDNIEFYHSAIWWTMDPNRRYMLLDGYLAPGSNERSIASVVENRLIGIIGNSLVMPVARGNHLDPRFRRDPKHNDVNLLDYYSLDSPVPPARVSLPTRGVFAEAVQGSCNACEQIDDSRFWRWDDAPSDEPPSIEPASTATRQSEGPGAQPSQFPTPMVSIQNAPSVPDPTGVAAMLQALGKQTFADITGLAGTQANAAAAYSKALDTALAFGKEASTLAQQAAALKALDKNMAAIDKAESQQKLPAEDAQRLRTTALEKAVGAPSTPKTSDVTEKLGTIKKAAEDEAVDPPVAKRLSETVLKSYVGEDAAAVPDEQIAATKAIDSVTAKGRVATVKTGSTEVTALPEIPGAPESVIPENFEQLLHYVERGAHLGEIGSILAQLSSAAPETLAAIEVAGEIAGGLVGGILTIVTAFIEIVNALDTGLRHDETMGWVYGITWAIDDAAAIGAGLPRPPRPTGVIYNPKGVGDPPEQRRARFDEGAQRGINVIASATTAEEEEVRARLTIALAIAIHQSGNVAGHKQFVTQLFRYAYRDGDAQHRETWSLDWPQMRVESIGP